MEGGRVIPDASKVFEKSKKPLAGLDKTKSLRPKKKIKEGGRGRFKSIRIWIERDCSNDLGLWQYVACSRTPCRRRFQ